jgi:hypothetical protein
MNLRYAFFVLSILAFPVWAEKLSFEIYKLDEKGARIRIAEGVKEYQDADFEVRKGRGDKHWSKSLSLANGFGVGASIYQEPKITGFGMWAQGSGCGFSWEWFNLSGPNSYVKLQESGEVSVLYRGAKEEKEIAEIKFDTDVSLRLRETRTVNRETHRILIKKGSILKFPSNSNLQQAAALSRPCD